MRSTLSSGGGGGGGGGDSDDDGGDGDGDGDGDGGLNNADHGDCLASCILGALRGCGRAFCGGVGWLERSELLLSVRCGHVDTAHFHCARAQNAVREMARGGARSDGALAARYLHAVLSTRACFEVVTDNDAAMVIANRIAPHHRPVLLVWPRCDPEQLLPRELRRTMPRSRLYAPMGASRCPVAEASQETIDALVSFTAEAAAQVSAREARPAKVKQSAHILTGEYSEARAEVAGLAAAQRDGDFKENSKFARSMMGTEVVLAGWLEKRSKLGQWQARYCEVSSHYLRYYTEKPKQGVPSDGADMRAAIDLLQVTKVEADGDAASGNRSFTIRFRDGSKTEMRVPLVSPADTKAKHGGAAGKKTAAEAALLAADQPPPAQVVSQWVELLSGGGGSAQFE